MSNGLVASFKVALLDHLNAHAGLRAVLGRDDRVFDIVPMDRKQGIIDRASLPLVHLGPMNVRHDGMPCGELTLDVVARIYCASDSPGREEAWNICEVLIAALHDLSGLPMGAGFSHQAVAVINAGDVIDPLSPRECFVDIQTKLQKG